MALKDVVTPGWLKARYLFGVVLTDDDGNDYPDALFEQAVEAAIDWLEGELGLVISDLVTVSDEQRDVTWNERADFYLHSLDKRPVREVTSARWGYGDFPETDIPAGWLHVRSDVNGQVQILPGQKSITDVFVGDAFWGLIGVQRRYIPGWLRFTYKAGWGGLKPGGDASVNDDANYDYPWPPLILEAVGLMAAILPLDTAGDLLVGAGIASKSISIPGLSQSVNTTSSATNAGYGAKLISYRKRLEEMVMPALRAKYRGVYVTVV